MRNTTACAQESVQPARAVMLRMMVETETAAERATGEWHAISRLDLQIAASDQHARRPIKTAVQTTIGLDGFLRLSFELRF